MESVPFILLLFVLGCFVLFFACMFGSALHKKVVEDAVGFFALSVVVLLLFMWTAFQKRVGDPAYDSDFTELSEGVAYEVLGNVAIPAGGEDVYVVIRDGQNHDKLYRLHGVPPKIFEKNGKEYNIRGNLLKHPEEGK